MMLLKALSLSCLICIWSRGKIQLCHIAWRTQMKECKIIELLSMANSPKPCRIMNFSDAVQFIKVSLHFNYTSRFKGCKGHRKKIAISFFFFSIVITFWNADNISDSFVKRFHSTIATGILKASVQMLKISVLVLFLHFADAQNKPCEFLRFSSELITELRSILVWKVQSNNKPSLIKQKPHIFFSPYPFLPAFWLLIFFIEYDFTLCWECRDFASWLNLELTAMTRKKVSGNEEMTRKKRNNLFLL